MKFRFTIVGLLALLAIAGCSRDAPDVIVVTATFMPAQTIAFSTEASQSQPAEPTTVEVAAVQLSPLPPQLPIEPTPDPSRTVASQAREHIVQPGDTLSLIAQRYSITTDELIAANQLINPNILSVGQVITLPDLPAEASTLFKILPDSLLVRGPGSSRFDVAGFVRQQPGYIQQATDIVTTRLANGAGLEQELSSAEIVERVALEYSVDPRLLLMVLEYRAGWLSNPQPFEDLKTHPLVSEFNQGFDRSGMYAQLSWAANELNRGYYGWKYGDQTSLLLGDGTRVQFAQGINPGTAGVQYYLGLYNAQDQWEFDTSRDGFFRLYYSYFGDPFAQATEPLVPDVLTAPELALPFAQGETWYFTGGAHGGWGSGSAWAAVDLAPPDERTDTMPFCFTSQHPVRAVAPGVIARSDIGTVILDLDGDGDESTGWSILYLHLDNRSQVQAGMAVSTGDTIGYAACAGGYSMATHLHIARRYNGEWIPADCTSCPVANQVPRFTMAGWQVEMLPGQEYQGFLVRNSEQRRAEQGRDDPVNYISW